MSWSRFIKASCLLMFSLFIRSRISAIPTEASDQDFKFVVTTWTLVLLDTRWAHNSSLSDPRHHLATYTTTIISLTMFITTDTYLRPNHGTHRNTSTTTISIPPIPQPSNR